MASPATTPPNAAIDRAGQANVKVYVRVRKFTDRELQLGDCRPTCRISSDGTQLTVLDPNRHWQPRETCTFERCFWSVPDAQLALTGHKDGEHDTPSAARTPVELSRSASFGSAALSASFNGVSFDPPPFATQHRVYEVVGSDMLRNILEGFNGCIFAYGQTGSGKTHTMMGDTASSETSGLVPRLVAALFDQVSTMCGGDPSLSFRVECGYFEVYNELVFDLLNPSADRRHLRVRQDPVRGPFVEDLSWRHVSAAETILELIHSGNAERRTAATKMNDRSSRSHAILCVSVAQFRRQDDGSSATVSSKLNLVDLAGSERPAQSGDEKGVSFKETAQINLSLTTLGRVIDALADSSAGQKAAACPPYRESLLTWLLKDSLGGNSKTVMIATLSPAATYYDEMLSTLRYACRARQIVNTVVVNENPLVMKVKELEIKNERLQIKIERLLKQVAALQASKISKEQLDEAEGRAANATKRVELRVVQLANFKSIPSMRESNLAGLRPELATPKAASEGSPLDSSLRTSTTSFARTASQTPLSLSPVPNPALRRTASRLSLNAPLAPRRNKGPPAGVGNEQQPPLRTMAAPRVVRVSGPMRTKPSFDATVHSLDTSARSEQLGSDRTESHSASDSDAAGTGDSGLGNGTPTRGPSCEELLALERRSREEASKRSAVNSNLRCDIPTLTEQTLNGTSNAADALRTAEAAQRGVLVEAEGTVFKWLRDCADIVRDAEVARCAAAGTLCQLADRKLATTAFEYDERMAAAARERAALLMTAQEWEGCAAATRRELDAASSALHATRGAARLAELETHNRQDVVQAEASRREALRGSAYQELIVLVASQAREHTRSAVQRAVHHDRWAAEQLNALRAEEQNTRHALELAQLAGGAELLAEHTKHRARGADDYARTVAAARDVTAAELAAAREEHQRVMAAAQQAAAEAMEHLSAQHQDHQDAAAHRSQLAAVELEASTAYAQQVEAMLVAREGILAEQLKACEALAAAERAAAREEHQRAMAAAQRKLSARHQFNLGMSWPLKAVALMLFVVLLWLAATPPLGGERGATVRRPTQSPEFVPTTAAPPVEATAAQEVPAAAHAEQGFVQTPRHGTLVGEEPAQEPPRSEAVPAHPEPSEPRAPGTPLLTCSCSVTTASRNVRATCQASCWLL
jgi:hypothetical protein